MKKTYAFLGILFIAVLAGLAVIFQFGIFGPSSRDGVCESNFGIPGDHTNQCAMGVNEPDAPAQLHYTMALSQGSIDWTLRDPSGNEAWSSDAVAGGQYDDTFTIEDAAAGKWVLEIRTHQAVGSYRFDWLAH